MKYTLHVPVEQYGFVAAEIESTTGIITNDDIAEEYRRIAEAFKPKPVNEMPTKDFQAILDDLMEDHSIAGDPGSLDLMSPIQKQIIQEIKKSIKRITKQKPPMFMSGPGKGENGDYSGMD